MSNNQTNNDSSGAAFGILLGLIILLAVFFIITRPAATVSEQEAAATDSDTVAQVTEEPAEEPTEAPVDEEPVNEEHTMDAPETEEAPIEEPTEAPVAEEPADSSVDGDEVVERTQAILDVMSMVVYGEDGPDVPPVEVDPVIVTPQPTPVPTEAPATPEPTEEPTEAPVSDEPATDSASTGTYTSEQIAAGEMIFSATCTACHGMDGQGIPGLGKDLVNGEFSLETPDDELVAMIQVGREFNDPLNTTGVPMPANGGNPALSTEDVYNIVAYMRALQGR